MLTEIVYDSDLSHHDKIMVQQWIYLWLNYDPKSIEPGSRLKSPLIELEIGYSIRR